MPYEKADVLLNNNGSWMNITTVIIDEIHIIGDMYRGGTIESLIIKC